MTSKFAVSSSKSSYRKPYFESSVPTAERYGIGLAEDNAPLRTAVNEALDAVVADGTYERIFTEWFPGRDVEQVIDLLR